jgi:ligand-binding sensor domain-containing protein
MSEVHARDPMLTKKVERLFETARSGGPNGKLYVATDTGVYLNSVASGNRGKLIVGVDNATPARRFDPQGRLIVGTDHGLWAASGEAAKAKSMNNLHQTGIAAHSSPTMEIFVSDAGSATGRVFRLSNVTITPSPRSFGRGQTLRLRFASVNN